MSNVKKYNQLEQSQQATGQSFPALLDKMKPQLMAALPRHLNADRMARIALTEYRKNPKLGKCNIESLLGSIVVLSQMGLEPGVLGQSYLVPYYDNKAKELICQPITGWQGIVELINRSGRASVWTGAVYPGDEFEWAYGDRPFITHRPGDDEADESQLLYAYAVGRVNGAEWPVIQVWSAAKIRKHRDKFNKVGDSHYSFSNWEMYGRKVPLLQVAKYMPKSVELQTALDLEAAAERGAIIDLQNAGDGTWTPQEEPQEQRRSTRPQAPPKPVQQAPESGSTISGEEIEDGEIAQESAPDEKADQTSNEPFTFSELSQAISDAESVEDVIEVLDLINSVKNEKNRTALKTMAENKKARLESPDDSDDDSMGLG